MSIINLHYEVFGKVQKVSFRKYTHLQAEKLGLRGWVENTAGGSVQGELQGPKAAIDSMKHWLRYEGSPKSKIERAVFSEQKEVPDFTFEAFTIKRH